MAQIAIYSNEDKIKSSLEIQRQLAAQLTGLYVGLTELGAENIDIDDLEELVKSDGHPTIIRKIILKGKDLRVAGIAINAETLQLPELGIRKLSQDAKRVDPGKNHLKNWDFFDIKNGAVVCLKCAETAIRKTNTVFGTEKTADIITDAQKMCDIMNVLFSKLDGHTHSPLRDPEALIKYNSETKTFSPNVKFIAGYVGDKQ
jgi:hypothetical protein